MMQINQRALVNIYSTCGDLIKLTLVDGNVLEMQDSKDYSFFMPVVQHSIVAEFANTVSNFDCLGIGATNENGNWVSIDMYQEQ